MRYLEDDARGGLEWGGGVPVVRNVRWLDVTWSFTEPPPTGLLTGFEVVLINGADPDDTSTYITKPIIVKPSDRRLITSVALNISLTNARSAVRALFGELKSAWRLQGTGQNITTEQAVLGTQAAVAAAQADATASLAELADISADGKLHKNEKTKVIREYGELTQEQAGIDAQAVNFSITTEKTNYDNSLAALTSYLGGLSPAWNNTGTTTTISRTIWDANWKDVYNKRQILLNKIADEAAKRANWTQIPDRPTTLYALDARSAAIIETRTDGALFSETFTDPNALSQWELSSGSGERSIVTDSEVTTGGMVLSVGNNAGNDQMIAIHKALIPVQDGKLYRVRARVKRTLGSGTAYVGVAGVRADGVTLANASGANTYSSQHYIAASGVNPPTTFVEYVGYFKGFATSGAGGQHPDWASPAKLYDTVRYVRPMLIVNYSGVAGTTLVDYFKIEEVPIDSQGRPTELYNGDQNATADIALVPGSNVYVSGNRVVKYAGGGSWNASCYSRESFTGGAYVSFSPEQNTAAIMVGLNSDPTTNESYDSIDYAMYCRTDGALYAYRHGVSQGAIGTYISGDVLAVIYNGVLVKWLKNGAVIFTFPAGPNQQLYMDSSFSSLGAISAVRFGPMTSNDWAETGGTGRPEDNATLGANLSTNVTNRYLTHLARNSGDATTAETLVSRLNNNGRPNNQRFLRAFHAPGTQAAKAGTAPSAADVGSTATITVPAWSIETDVGTISYNSGSITGLAFSTKYYVYCVDGDLQGGAVTYVASTDYKAASQNADRVYVGTITTPADGGSGTGGGSGGGDWCVAVTALLPDACGGTPWRAALARAGKSLLVLNATDDGTTVWPVRSVDFATADCIELETVSGITLTISTSTPITLRGGEVIRSPECLGRDVPVLDAGVFRWEPVVALRPAGLQTVARVHADQLTYAAGNQPHRYILTHNINQKP